MDLVGGRSIDVTLDQIRSRGQQLCVGRRFIRPFQHQVPDPGDRTLLVPMLILHHLKPPGGLL
jgi:hypothetical protein